jgi:hypothetical protein
MKSLKTNLQILSFLLLASFVTLAQTGDTKNYAKDGLSFDYPSDWTLQDNSNGDAQQLSLGRANNDVQIRLFVHKGKISPEKLPDAKKAFIDPCVANTGKQFVAMGANPKQSPDSTEIGGVKSDGVNITASLGGEPGAAKIYWALIGQHVAILTYFGPDKELKQFAPAWDLVRTSLKIAAPQADAKPVKP